MPKMTKKLKDYKKQLDGMQKIMLDTMVQREQSQAKKVAHELSESKFLINTIKAEMGFMKTVFSE